MVDLHPTIAKLLRQVAPVELSFPNAKAKYPVITITELGNSTSAIFDGRERLSEHNWQIDCWDNSDTPAYAEEMAKKVNAILSEKGMRRYFGQLIRDPSAKQRYCLRYRFTLDEQTFFVYRS